eukprot:m.165988 g.165988  ORF g.165988 m.165988 type:complete len:1012 (-) comp14438_c1_seq7:229-3264(-)
MRSNGLWACLVTLILLLVCRSGHAAVYPYAFSPFDNPQVLRNFVQPPPRSVIGNVTRFAASRGLPLNSTGYVVNYEEAIYNMTTLFDIGDVLWPTFNFLYAPNLNSTLQALKNANILVTDIWDYVPGDTDDCRNVTSVCEFKLSDAQSNALRGVLSDRYTGMDVGEQDGRYIGNYALQMQNPGDSRQQQYIHFWQHFDRMASDLGDKLSSLTSLYMPHYLLKTGLYTSVASETGQALPNAQLFMAFNRGAAKQYLAWWWANVSVYNRWGYKNYPNSPTGGTSLSLMKRLMYSQILYNSVYCSFEANWVYNDSLTPIGTIQHNARVWTRTNMDKIGIFQAPIAVLLDFYAGWNPPRHLYTSSLYRVWGNLPYEEGDHMTHAVLDQLYPDYVDSSYFHNEHGFQAPTPYGDGVDVLLSDVSPTTLQPYSVVVVAGELCKTTEGCPGITAALEHFVSQGGQIVIAASSLYYLSDRGVPLFNITTSHQPSTCAQFPAGTKTVSSVLGDQTEPLAFTACTISFAQCNACTPKSIASTTPSSTPASMPLVYQVTFIAGSGIAGGITVLATPNAVTSQAQPPLPVTSGIDTHLPTVYPLTSVASRALDMVYKQNAQIFSVNNPKLTFSVNSVDNENGTRFTLGIFNSNYSPQAFKISLMPAYTSCATLSSVAEIELAGDDETNDPGYLPPGIPLSQLGNNTATQIAGGAVRLFRVVLNPSTSGCIRVLSKIKYPVSRPFTAVSFGQTTSTDLSQQFLLRTRFKQQFDSVVLDWRQVLGMGAEALQRNKRLLAIYNATLFVDLTSGVNLYPDLRIVKNSMSDYNASIETIKTVIDKTNALGGQQVILSLHRIPENYYTAQQCWTDWNVTVSSLAQYAAPLGVKILLRNAPGKQFDVANAKGFIDGLGASNVKMALSTGHALQTQQAALVGSISSYIDFVYISCPSRDPLTNQVWTHITASLSDCQPSDVSTIQSSILSKLPSTITLAVEIGAPVPQHLEYENAAAMLQWAARAATTARH